MMRQDAMCLEVASCHDGDLLEPDSPGSSLVSLAELHRVELLEHEQELWIAQKAIDEKACNALLLKVRARARARPVPLWLIHICRCRRRLMCISRWGADD